MKRPKVPPAPKPDDLAAAMLAMRAPSTAEEIRRLVAKASAAYFHWDELRVRPMPAGVRPAAVWTLVKLGREGDRRTLPLTDVDGRSFGYSLPNQALEAFHAVDRWGGGTLALDDGSFLDSTREQIVVGSLIEEAIATSQIEGAATTRPVAKAMLRTKRPPRDRSEQMIVNSFVTMQFLREQRERELSLDLLFEIQARMTRDTLDEPGAVGRLRTAAEKVRVVDTRSDAVLFTPPPAELLPERLQRLVTFANAPAEPGHFTHPLVKAATLHFWLAYEHPFVDGNGRTARALFYWFMLKSGYWLFEFLTISRAIMKSRGKYYRSFLYSEHDGGDLTYSLLFMLQATQQAIVDLRDHLRLKQEEERAMNRTLRALPDLNQRQRTLLNDALKRPGELITFQSHALAHGITYVTARSDLLDLLERKLLQEVGGRGRQRSFVGAERLEQVISDANRPRRA